MVALALNPLAEEFCPHGTPPGLIAAPPGVHAVVDIEEDDFGPPPGLTLPTALSCPPGLALVDEQESKQLTAPPGRFAPPGDFSPPGRFAAAGPPGFFAAGPPGVLSTCTSPPGQWVKDSDARSASGISTDADSDSESSCGGSFSE